MNRITSTFAVAGAVIAAAVSRGSNATPDARDMVLQPTDLPLGWRRGRRRRFRTGLIAPAEPWAQRLRKARATSYVVGYRHDADRWSLLSSQSMPLLDEHDAIAAFAGSAQRLIPNPDPLVGETSREAIELDASLGDERQGFVLSSISLREPGSRGTQFVAMWRRRSCIAFLALSGHEGTWTVADLVALASSQDARMVGALAEWQAGVGQ